MLHTRHTARERILTVTAGSPSARRVTIAWAAVLKHQAAMKSGTVRAETPHVGAGARGGVDVRLSLAAASPSTRRRRGRPHRAGYGAPAAANHPVSLPCSRLELHARAGPGPEPLASLPKPASLVAASPRAGAGRARRMAQISTDSLVWRQSRLPDRQPDPTAAASNITSSKPPSAPSDSPSPAASRAAASAASGIPALGPQLIERVVEDVIRRVDKRIRVERERRGL